MYDMDTQPLIGVFCGDNKSSVFNGITRNDNSYLANCHTTAVNEDRLEPTKFKYQRVSKLFIFNRLNVLLDVKKSLMLWCMVNSLLQYISY
jgi:hypothetical protein